MGSELGEGVDGNAALGVVKSCNRENLEEMLTFAGMNSSV
jgi:hypothetical protein